MSIVNELKKVSFFENLDDKELALLATFSRKKTFSKGEILFYEKEIPVSLTLLTEGLLKVYKTDVKNNEIVLHRFEPTSLIAEMAILEDMPYPASGSFDSDGSVIEIDFEKFKEAFFNNLELSLKFFKSLSKKIKYLESVIALNIFLNQLIPNISPRHCP